MIFKFKKIVSVSLLTGLLLCSCNTQPLQNENKITSLNSSNIKNSMIKGRTELSDFNKSFSAKAVPDFATRATVSLIYPNDYSNKDLREATIATGLTDNQGNFSINAGFVPEYNQVMVLESSKRIKGASYSNISLRTHIRWNGTKWESISIDKIVIDKKTTSIALVSLLEPNTLTSSETINRLSYNATSQTVIYSPTFTESIYKRYLGNVSSNLNSSIDPVRFYPNSIYINATNRAKQASVKSNMHTFQTLVETYAVDWGGYYPDSFEMLEKEAKERNYFKNARNPFGSLNKEPVFVNDSDYRLAKTTLTYKGQPIDDISFFAGVVTYEPIIFNYNNEPYITKYFIYGVDIDGEYLQDKGIDFTLTNQ